MTFQEWLQKELDKRRFSHSELARRIQMSQSRVSQVMNGDTPSADFCVSVAKELKIPVEKVLRKAKLIPPSTVQEEEKNKLIYYFEKMAPDDRKRFIVMARALSEFTNKEE